jgi:hypothetical protein
MTQPLDIVEIRKDDMQVGDYLIGIDGQARRVTHFEPYVGANLAIFGEGTRIVVCADGYAMTLTSARYRIRRRPEVADVPAARGTEAGFLLDARAVDWADDNDLFADDVHYGRAHIAAVPIEENDRG